MQADSDCIQYCKPEHAYGWMSNFYPAPFQVGQVLYPTSEHYYQSKKFEGKPEEKKVIQARNPTEAFNLGRKFQYRPNWKHIKEDIMYQALKHKFGFYPELREQLLKTGEMRLVEHFQSDSYWSDGGNGSGKNRMGVLLMRLRKELREDHTKRADVHNKNPIN